LRWHPIDAGDSGKAGPRSSSSILYFKVTDIEHAHKVLASRGVHFETKPMLVAPMATHDLWLAEFRDSENNVLALMCEKPKAAKS
jgi:predicted enzyme related to lactoylglutathione lyase